MACLQFPTICAGGMTELSNAMCSVTATQRRRYLWAAWWTGTPSQAPFRKPDASNGGYSSEAEAFAAAERSTGRHLTPIEPYWARAWNRILRGEAAPPPPAKKALRVEARMRPNSAWEELGLEPGATLHEVKRGYRKRALETHPDQGGDAESFARVQRAYEKLAARLAGKRQR